jgi:hypothetical protein
MAERLELRNESDVKLLTESRKSSCAVSSDRIRPSSQFGVRLECKVVVNLENYDVDSLFGQGWQILAQRIQRVIGAVVEKMQRTPWFGLPDDICFDRRSNSEYQEAH